MNKYLNEDKRAFISGVCLLLDAFGVTLFGGLLFGWLWAGFFASAFLIVRGFVT